MKDACFDRERYALFDSKEELEQAIKNGYQLAYMINRCSMAELPVPKWFTVNGKSYPCTPNLFILKSVCHLKDKWYFKTAYRSTNRTISIASLLDGA